MTLLCFSAVLSVVVGTQATITHDHYLHDNSFQHGPLVEKKHQCFHLETSAWYFVMHILHYKKPMFFVMFQKTWDNVKKNRDDVRENVT